MTIVNKPLHLTFSTANTRTTVALAEKFFVKVFLLC